MVYLPGNNWVAYNRVSSEEQARSADALARQIYETKTALEGAGKDVPDEPQYVDVQTAWDDNEHNRPAFSRLLNDISAGLVDGIVVTENSRIGRETEVLSRFWKFLEQHGVQLFVITKGRPYLFENAGINKFSHEDWGDFMADALKSESESRKISNRVSRSRQYDRHLKRAHPKPPFGYKRSADKKYEPDTRPWPAIPGLTAWDVALKSIEILVEEKYVRQRAVARIKNELKKSWTVSGFGHWIKNEVLCGHTPYLRWYEGKQKQTMQPEKVRNKKRVMSIHAKPGDRYGAPTILHKHTHQRLITEEQEREIEISFRVAQARQGKRTSRVYPLSGISYCAECGGGYSWVRSFRSNIEDFYGFCRNRYKPCSGPEDVTWCPSREAFKKTKSRKVRKGIRQEDAEKEVAKRLAARAEDALAKLKEDMSSEVVEDNPARVRIEAQITQISALIASMGDSEGHLRAQIEMLQKQLPRIGIKASILGTEDQKVLEALQRPEVFLSMPIERRKEVYLRFVRRIEFYRHRVDSVTFYF